MKFTHLFAASIALALFVGCTQNDSAEGTDGHDAATSRVDSILGSGGGNAAASNAAAPTGDVKLNPAHGQPGHRCEIAVGAPLNTAPAASNEPPLTITQNPPAAQPAVKPTFSVSPSPAATPTESPAAMLAKGLNPPHGAPGHDCAVAVGAPLKK